MNNSAMNFWGWGLERKSPDEDSLREMAELLESLFEGENLSIMDPPTLDGITLPSSVNSIPNELQEWVSNSKESRIHHTYGKNFRDLVRGFNGNFDNAPDFVAYPESETHIREIYRWADEKQLAVIPFGGGTSVVGGVEADVPASEYRGAVSVDMKNLDRLIQLDEESQSACLEAGATGPEIEDMLESYGLTLRHYPQSYQFSTLGGWIATRSSGHYATNETHIDDFVESIRIVTPSGQAQTLRVPASGAGPNPDRFFLGSEGTLGIITQATVRVREKPKYRSHVSVKFDEFRQAVRAVRRIAQTNLYPANCRLLGPNEALLHQVSMDGASVLILGFESTVEATESQLDEALSICQRYDGRKSSSGESSDRKSTQNRAGEAQSWRDAFFDGPYLFNGLVQLGMVADTFETACEWSDFFETHKRIVNTVKNAMQKVCGNGFLSCRFTHIYPNGPAPYYTFLAPGSEGSRLEQWAHIKQVASDAIRDSEATITHHHAVGRVHRPWYQAETPDRFLDVLRAAKNELDPSHLLNPGVLLTEE